MTDETDAPQGGTEVEAIADTSEVELNAEDTNAQPTGAEDAGQADDAGEATKRVPWFQKRIDEVTRQKYDAQREADYWRGLAEGRGSSPQPQQQVEAPDMFEDPEGFKTWLKKEAAAEVRAELRQEQRATSYEERANAFRAQKPDYDALVGDPSLPVTPLMADVIRDSDKGPEVAYYLGTNRSEAARIANLPPHLQAAAMGRIEASLSTPAQTTPQPKRNPPPPPPQTVNGLSAGLPKPAEDMSMAEYIAARNAGSI